VRPIPQSIEAAAAVSRATGETDLLDGLQATADAVQLLVPDCVGLSVAWVEHGVTFTLVASDDQIALLDALQYLDGGPCVEAVDLGHGLETRLLGTEEEQRWQLFAQANASAGVRCTLTFPLTEEGRVVGSVNLYGASDHAFEDVHDELARLLGSQGPWVTRNADLSFESRRTAEKAPDVLRAQGAVAQAVGMLAARDQLTVGVAQQRLEQAADRAGISVGELAQALLQLRDGSA
jgi:hypothetical protein